MPKLWDEAEGKQCCQTIVGPVGLAGVTLILGTKGIVPARMAAANPSRQQEVPPSEGQWHPEQFSSWGVARGEFSRACAPSSATVYAFQPPQKCLRKSQVVPMCQMSLWKNSHDFSGIVLHSQRGRAWDRQSYWLGVDRGPWIKIFAHFPKHCWQGIEVIFREFQYLYRENDILGTGSQGMTEQTSRWEWPGRTSEAVWGDSGGEQGWGLTAPGDHVGPPGCLAGQVQLVFCSWVMVKICVGWITLTAPHRDKSL